MSLDCTLDYETRGKPDLTKVGAIEYAKEAEIFCLGYKINDEPAKIWIPERAPMPPDLWEAFKHGILIAHNAAFERAITKYCLTRYPLLTREQRKFLFNLSPSRWKCTAAKAAASSLPRKLEEACKALSLPTQKDMAGHKLIMKYSRPRRISKNDKRQWWDAKNDLRRIYSYCITDVNAEWELDHSIPDLSPFEQKVWELDQKINDRGILIDIPLVKTILGLIDEEKEEIKKEVQFYSDGRIESATQRAKVLEFINEHGADMKNLQAPTIKDKLEEPGLHPLVKKILECRQSASMASTAKYKAMIKAAGSDDRARELLLYWGTQPTARWAGRRIQPQNFPRPKFENFDQEHAIELIKTGDIERIKKEYGHAKIMDVFASCIRGMLIPSPDNEFYCADFAGIEARLAFWFAGHDDGVAAFKDGRKLYEEMASDTFGIPLDDIKKESVERFVGKESILGCQYGLGPNKFLTQCHKKGMKMVTPEIAKKAVNAYREKHFPVPEAWRSLEKTVILALKNKGDIYETCKTKIYFKGRFLFIELPSGRKLKYFKPSIAYDEYNGRRVPKVKYWSKGWENNPKTGKPHKAWCKVTIWGGTFFNHIVQGAARDLMVHGIMRIEAAGYKFVLSVHDEGLSEKKIGKGSLKEYLHLMSGDLPEWASGAPIKAEGWVGVRYRK